MIRTRGKRAGLSRAIIVNTACQLDHHELNIQAVANELGVDRKAIHHYVPDLNTLLSLVAEETFASHFDGGASADCASWQEALRLHAAALANAAMATGNLVTYLDPRGPMAVPRFIASTEAALELLVSVGATDHQALRTIAMLTNICLAYARDMVSDADTRRPALLHQALSSQDAGSLPVLTRMDAASLHSYDHAQLEFSLDILISGVEVFL